MYSLSRWDCPLLAGERRRALLRAECGLLRRPVLQARRVVPRHGSQRQTGLLLRSSGGSQVTVIDIGLLTARMLLAVVFLVAAIAKLFDRHGSRVALTDFGVPERIARWLDVLLPACECVVAVAL